MLAIVLKRMDFRETDQLVSFYTEEKGKLTLLARGVKKIVSKNSAHLELFSLVDIDIAYGKELSYVTKVIPIDYVRSVREDLSKSLLGQSMVAILDKLCEEGEPNHRIFSLVVTFLKFLAEVDRADSFYLDVVIFQILNELGFQMALQSCVVCGNNLNKVNTSAFYFAGGGVLCHNCALIKKKIGEEMIPIHFLELGELRFLLSANLESSFLFKKNAQFSQKIHTIIFSFLLYHSEKKIMDWDRLLQALD